MALVHQATLTPSKLELLGAWLPNQPWFRNGGELARVGSYRFDDPAGEVGIEIMLVQSGDSVFQVPLTYRGAELREREQFLVGTMDHSVLGARWIYDGCGDPVAVNALATAILTGGTETIVEVELEGNMVTLPSISVRGSGTSATAVPTVDVMSCVWMGEVTQIVSRLFRLDVARLVGATLEGQLLLSATWEGHSDVPVVGLVPLTNS